MTEFLKMHHRAPVRREVATQVRYALYRDDLRLDFLQACGYCGDGDERIDRSTFHIDHFAPKKRFPELELAYTNLVYACRFCNVSKSDHWIGNDPKVPNNGTVGFVDPCSDDYDIHLGRDAGGRIVARTELGRYIIRRLSLHLIRHELLWRARRMRIQRGEIQNLIDEYKVSGRSLPEYAGLLDRFFELTKSIENYELRAVSQ
ncbi:HNH endonuclease [Niveispirillum sp. KHB5.9]|uniref:HNH endonuclease n=1 Tax=Niveispirillum sp. KHB5.9 TaxID=3400269 RepID=UPI003A88847B